MDMVGVREIPAKSILNKHRRRDSWFLDDYSLNPYINCQFGCVYCYIHGGRYGKRIGGIAVKINAPSLLERELRNLYKAKKFGFIALSSSTEPWQPIENRYMITRKCLEIVLRYRFPIHVLTKSDLVLRDFNILKLINENAILPVDLSDKINCGLFLTVSLSTIDEGIARIFEPHAPPPSRRLDIIEKAVNNGICAGVAYIPVLPYISDSTDTLEEMVLEAKSHGARYVFFGALTLEGKGKRAFFSIIEREFPELLNKYQRLYRTSFQPSREYQNRLYSIARSLCRKYNVKYSLLAT